MYHQLKITSYSFIVALVPLLFLSSQATALPHPSAPVAQSCKGWKCGTGTGMFDPKEGSICWEGSPGASDASYVCRKGKWTEAEPALCIHVPDGKPLLDCLDRAKNYMPSCMKRYNKRYKKSKLCTDTSIECLSEDVKSKAFQLAVGVMMGAWWGDAQAECHRDFKQLIKDMNNANRGVKGCNYGQRAYKAYMATCKESTEICIAKACWETL